MSPVSLPLDDIILPPAPPPWPPGPAVWWLLLMAGLACGLLGLAVYRRRRHSRVRRRALHQLKNLQPAAALHARNQQLHQVNALLRQCCLGYFPRQQIAGLTGKNWWWFLLSQLPDNKHTRISALNVLADAQRFAPPAPPADPVAAVLSKADSRTAVPAGSHAVARAEVQAVWQAAEYWLRHAALSGNTVQRSQGPRSNRTTRPVC